MNDSKKTKIRGRRTALTPEEYRKIQEEPIVFDDLQGDTMLEYNEEFQELREDQQEIVEMLLDGNGYTDIEAAIMASDDVIDFGEHAKEQLCDIEDDNAKAIKHLLPYVDYKKYGNDTYMDYTEYNGNLYLIP